MAATAYRPIEQARPHYLKRLVYKTPLTDGPNPRELSNLLGAISYDSPKSSSSMWKVLFAQLITHDLSSQRSNATRFDVPLPLTDRFITLLVPLTLSLLAVRSVITYPLRTMMRTATTRIMNFMF